jgi:hypothetical protein
MTRAGIWRTSQGNGADHGRYLWYRPGNRGGVRDRGASLVLAGRRERERHESLRIVRQAGGEAIFVPSDVTVEDDVLRTVATAVDTYGTLDYSIVGRNIIGLK